MDVEELSAKREEVIARGEEIINGLDGKQPTPEQTDELRGLKDKLAEVNTAIAAQAETAGLVDEFASARAAQEQARESGRPPLYSAPRQNIDFRTPGEMYVESPAYKDWMARFPLGAPTAGTYQGDSVEVGERFRSLLGISTATEKLRQKMAARTLITAADTSAGDLVRPDWRGLLEPGLVRPQTVRDLVTVIPVGTDAIEYAKETSRTSAAAFVAEATALTGSSGTKPEGGLVFDIVTDTVKTMAAWVAATKRILADARGLAAYINQYLTDDIRTVLEDQMVTGDGAGENFRGILNTVGIQTQAVPAGTETMLDVLRYAKRKIRVNARTNPTAVLINPEDLELIDTLKSINSLGVLSDVSGGYFGDPFAWNANRTIWGVPIVESETVPVKTALMGDFNRCVLFDREQTNISVGTSGDDFLRNIVRVLAEMRAGFGVIRPAAFCSVTLRS